MQSKDLRPGQTVWYRDSGRAVEVVKPVFHGVLVRTRGQVFLANPFYLTDTKPESAVDAPVGSDEWWAETKQRLIDTSQGDNDESGSASTN